MATEQVLRPSTRIPWMDRLRVVTIAGVVAIEQFGFGTQHLADPPALGRYGPIARPDIEDQGEIPNEDARSLVFDDTLLFDTDKFSGFDRIETGTRANVGIQYSVSAASGWKSSTSLCSPSDTPGDCGPRPIRMSGSVRCSMGMSGPSNILAASRWSVCTITHGPWSWGGARAIHRPRKRASMVHLVEGRVGGPIPTM